MTNLFYKSIGQIVARHAFENSQLIHFQCNVVGRTRDTRASVRRYRGMSIQFVDEFIFFFARRYIFIYCITDIRFSGSFAWIEISKQLCDRNLHNYFFNLHMAYCICCHTIFEIWFDTDDRRKQLTLFRAERVPFSFESNQSS